MPIKDKEKAREYKRLWMAKSRQQQKNNVEPVEPSFVEPSPKVEPENVEPLKSVEPVEPKKENVEPSKCSRCQILETQLKQIYPTYPIIMEEEKPNNIKKHIGELEQQTQDLQQRINPTIERWKTDYFALEKKSYKEATEQQTTINRLKEKLREQTIKNQSPNTNITQQENQAENKGNSLSNLYQLIKKHQQFQTIQHKYNDKELKEREFLKSLLDKLWIFD